MTKEEIEALQARAEAAEKELAAVRETSETRRKELTKLEQSKNPALQKVLSTNRAKAVADLTRYIQAGSKDPSGDLEKEYEGYASLFQSAQAEEKPAEKPADKGPTPADLAASLGFSPIPVETQAALGTVDFSAELLKVRKAHGLA